MASQTLLDIIVSAGADLPEGVVVKEALRVLAKFNPNHAPAGSPEGGQFTSGDGGGNWTIPKGPYKKVTSAVEALIALKHGQYVEMPANQISVLLDKLAILAQHCKERGVDAPVYDLCKITVSDTNLFCAESKGIPRARMPQMDDKAGFRTFLKQEGIKFRDEEVRADYLRATQNELDGAKVAGMMVAQEKGTLPKERIFVSSDNYVLDGHHRWAATVGEDYHEDNKPGDLTMPVTRIALPISVLLVLSEKFSGTSHRAVGKYFAPIVKAFPDQRYTFSVVYPASNPREPWVDAHREWATADELQKAQWSYVQNGDRAIYAQHGMIPGIGMKKLGEWVDLVTWPRDEEWEFKLPTGEVQKHRIPAGSVYMGILWTDEAWPAVKAGRIRGLSFGGRARRILVERVKT